MFQWHLFIWSKSFNSTPPFLQFLPSFPSLHATLWQPGLMRCKLPEPRIHAVQGRWETLGLGPLAKTTSPAVCLMSASTHRSVPPGTSHVLPKYTSLFESPPPQTSYPISYAFILNLKRNRNLCVSRVSKINSGCLNKKKLKNQYIQRRCFAWLVFFT